VRVLLMSDIHVQGPDMPPSRVSRIVTQANSLHPDLILLAGDFEGERAITTHDYSVSEATAPLAQLRATFGVVAVLGNHDKPKLTDETRQALDRANIIVLDNEAMEFGPIALAGFRSRPGKTANQLDRLPGAKLLVAHSPDLFAKLPSNISLMLAGHTHCGQIVLPLIGPIATGSQFGTRYLCGIIHERGQTLIVSAGLGTSRLPFRIGAPPDMWLITLEGGAPVS